MKVRNKGNGRYAFGSLDLVCRCGHTLGIHTAERRGKDQPCLKQYAIGDDLMVCPCDSFEPKRGKGCTEKEKQVSK